MTRKRDIRKSEFIALEALETNDYFDFVRQGQNFRISREDLLAALGTTGDLQQLGEATATPVLRIIADINYIRNILGNRGISVSTSPQEGIQIGHNFTVDDTGIPIMINEGAASPTIRSLVAGNGINIAGSGDIIQIASSELPESAKTIVVYSIDDFPDPDLIETDLIILEDDTEYKLENDVTSVYRFQMGSETLLSGADGSLVNLEYTGSGTMITALDVNFKIKDIRLVCSTGTLYDISSTTGLHRFMHFNGNCICANMGTIDEMRFVYLDNVNFSAETNGVLFTGNFLVCIINLVAISMLSGAGTGINLGSAVFDIFQLNQSFSTINTTGYAVSGLPDSGNIAVGGLGTIQNSKQFGTADFLGGITPYDDRWEMLHNAGVPNSYDVVMATHPATTIDIGAANPARLGTTWTTHKEYRFDSTVTGTWTYTGKGTAVEILACVRANIVSGSDSVTFYLAKNGVEIVNSGVTLVLNIVDPANVFTLIWDEDLVTGDYLEIWARNNDANVDIDVVESRIRIRS